MAGTASARCFKGFFQVRGNNNSRLSLRRFASGECSILACDSKRGRTKRQAEGQRARYTQSLYSNAQAVPDSQIHDPISGHHASLDNNLRNFMLPYLASRNAAVLLSPNPP